jgi:hypothetical protein
MKDLKILVRGNTKKDKNNTTELSVFSINYWVLVKVLMAQTNRAA